MSFFILRGIYDNPNTSLSVTIAQLGDFSFCGNASISNTPALFNLYTLIPLFLLGFILLALAVTQTLKQSVAMYKATKLWQPNRYIQQFMQDGILYFLLNALYNLVLIMLENDPTINSTLLLFLTSLSYTLLFVFMPRFIIGIRELYDRDLHGRRQGIDTRSGVSQPIGGGNAVVSAIAFAAVAPGQGQTVDGDEDDSEAIRLEVLGGGTRHVVEGDEDDELEAIRVEPRGDRTCQV